VVVKYTNTGDTEQIGACSNHYHQSAWSAN